MNDQDYRSLCAEHNQNLEEVIKAIHKLIEAKRNEITNYFYLGYAHIKLKQWQLALAPLITAIEMCTKLDATVSQTEQVKQLISRNLYYRGLCQDNLGHQALALADYSQSLVYNPRSVIVLEKRAAIYFKQRNLEKSIEDQSVIIQLAPNNINALFQRGSQRFKSFQIEALESKEFTPDQLKSYLDNLDQVIDDFKKIILLNPNHFQSHLYLANLYLEQNKLDLSIQSSTKAIDIMPTHVPSYLHRARAYFKNHNINNCCEDINRALGYSHDVLLNLYKIEIKLFLPWLKKEDPFNLKLIAKVEKIARDFKIPVPSGEKEQKCQASEEKENNPRLANIKRTTFQQRLFKAKLKQSALETIHENMAHNHGVDEKNLKRLNDRKLNIKKRMSYTDISNTAQVQSDARGSLMKLR